MWPQYATHNPFDVLNTQHRLPNHNAHTTTTTHHTRRCVRAQLLQISLASCRHSYIDPMAISSRLPVAVAPPPSSAAFGGGRRYTNHQHHRRSTAGSWAFLLCASALLVAWILYTAASLQHQAHQLHTGAHHLRSPPTLDELYGPQDGRWPSSAASGPSQLLVLSYYSSKASLAARLLMLLGVYAGEPSQLRIGEWVAGVRGGHAPLSHRLSEQPPTHDRLMCPCATLPTHTPTRRWP